jgi:predicted RNA-binding protein with PIN domain
MNYNSLMPYLIDGHNLIPKIGLRLDSPDDEVELIRILQEFARLSRREVEVYFDGAPIGQAGARKYGMIKAHFVRAGQTADSAIRARLNQMGKAPKGWIVVSSDHEVQSAARVNQAEFISSDAFVKELRQALQSVPKPGASDKKLSAQEVNEWLEIFRDKGH